MTRLLILLTAVFALTSTFLAIKLAVIRKSMKEISRSLSFFLTDNTNSPITVSSSDSSVRHLASELNEEMTDFIRKRNRMASGSTELHNAVTNIAHDLRTPLTAISGYLQLLADEEHTDDSKRYIEIISERTESLKALADSLFEYSVIATVNNELTFEPSSMVAETEVALAASYTLLAEHGITPDISLPEEPVERMLDKNAYGRILGNIFSNAARYSDGDLKVVLDTSGTLTVSNTAAALNEIEVGRLFDRFYTVENGRGGCGIGLSIARLLTEKMGGTISAEYTSDTLTIRLYFPR